MSRRIADDFAALNNFLSKYNLASYGSIPKSIELCKCMHKKLLGFLIFCAEFNLQNICSDCIPYFEEMSSDLRLSLFCAVQGMYKPAKLQLRCSIEIFFKSLIMISKPTIIQEKSVYAIFDAAKSDSHFSTTYGVACYNLLHNDYATLCRTVHGNPTVMHPTSALVSLPQYDEKLFEELADIYVRIVESFLGILYLNYPVVVDQMHPENKKDFLDCITKTTKSSIMKTLYSE